MDSKRATKDTHLKSGYKAEDHVRKIAVKIFGKPIRKVEVEMDDVLNGAELFAIQRQLSLANRKLKMKIVKEGIKDGDE